MQPSIEQSIDILSRTPAVLRALLADVPEPFERSNEGEDSWSPFDIVGHLIHGDRTDWIPRFRRILDEGESVAFEPFDRFAQFDASKGKSLGELLDGFAAARERSLAELRELGLSTSDFERTGTHPAFGRVTLGQLLATWVVHDLGHVAQISRVMAKQMKTEIGPWAEYLPIVSR